MSFCIPDLKRSYDAQVYGRDVYNIEYKKNKSEQKLNSMN